MPLNWFGAPGGQQQETPFDSEGFRNVFSGTGREGARQSDLDFAPSRGVPGPMLQPPPASTANADWASLSQQASSLGIPYWDISANGAQGQDFLTALQDRIKQVQEPANQTENWWPNTTNSPQLLSQTQLNQGTTPYPSYFDKGGIASRTDLSAQMQTAKAAGDWPTFQRLLGQFQAATGSGTFPMWMTGMGAPTPNQLQPWQQAMVDSGAGPGGYGSPAATTPAAAPPPGGGQPVQTMPYQQPPGTTPYGWLPNLQGQPGGGGGQAAPGTSGYPNYLTSIFNNGGNPIDQMPAWQAMIAAQERQLGAGRAALDERFNTSGNRFSTAYGTALTDYESQARLGQDAMLAQMTAAAQESAQGRQLQAGGQLSSQDFQSQMQQYQIAAQMAQMLSQQGAGATSQLANLGAGAANTLFGGAMTGTQGLFGTENQAARDMFMAQLQTLPQFMNYDQSAQQLGLGAAGNLSQLWNQNINTGLSVQQQQYMQQQNAINNLYQQWMYQQPQNNPLLQMMYGAVTNFPAPVYPGYQPGALGGLMQMIGTLGGAAISDARLKEMIKPVEGVLSKLPKLKAVTFRYKQGRDLPRGPQLGVLAQDFLIDYPAIVSSTPSGFYSVNYGSVAALALQAVKELQVEVEQLKRQLKGLEDASTTSTTTTA